MKSKKDKSKIRLVFLAGVEGLEPSQTVLETGVLPLTPYPYIKLYDNACLVGRQFRDLKTFRWNVFNRKSLSQKARLGAA